MSRSDFEFLRLSAVMKQTLKKIEIIPPGRSKKPTVFLPSAAAFTTVTKLTLAFATFADGFWTPAVRLPLLLCGGAFTFTDSAGLVLKS
jgi:hypothetical protein